MPDFYKDEIEFNSKEKVKKKMVASLLDDLDELDTTVLPSFLASNAKEEKEKKKVEPKVQSQFSEPAMVAKNPDAVASDTDEWIEALHTFCTPKSSSKKKKNFFGNINLDGKKKKKKKDKKKGEGLTNYKREFDPELSALHALLYEQDKFVDGLQKKYDAMENSKSTARGIGKYTNDLINSITTARALSVNLTKEIIATKKTIADLTFKDKKEFGSNASSEQTNMSNYATTFLKQMTDMGRNNFVSSGVEDGYEDADTDDLFSGIDESLGDTERDSDIEKYLKYENDGIQIEVIYNDDAPDDDLENKYQFIALNRDGDQVHDYPLPEKTRLSINRSTATATDIYGNKYHMQFI
jgi:hypothetical protein